jgi:two-component system KDP operon response regulator KdpE
MNKAKVLIVEDDDDLRQGLTLRLRASGYGVILAEDGVAAVSVAVRERPDVVLLDLGLPGGDGVTVLERYAKLPEIWSIPVVVLTGRDPGTARRDIENYLVAAFLQKPVDNDELLVAIDMALAGSGAPGRHADGGVPAQAGPPVPFTPPTG